MECIEPFRKDRFFHEALKISKVPSPEWLRQKLDKLGLEDPKGNSLRNYTNEMSVRLIERSRAPITAHNGYVRLDFDTFTMNNSGTKKEEVSRTYQGFDGYTPIAAYLGNEGWCINLELRPGSQHSAADTNYFLVERTFPSVLRLVPETEKILAVSDSGFDSAQLLFAHDDERSRYRALSRSFDWIIKWNPRNRKVEDWVAHAHTAGATWTEIRPGKRECTFDQPIDREWAGQSRRFRLVLKVTERTIDKKGQALLSPSVEVEGWQTSLVDTPEAVIAHYAYHGTHEQFHSEIKTDLDMERLPSGKYGTNDAVLHLSAFAYNCLRLIGQLGLTGENLSGQTSSETSQDSDSVAGGDVSGGAVHYQGQAADSGLWVDGCPCGAGVRSCARPSSDSTKPMNSIRRFITKQENVNSMAVEGKEPFAVCQQR